MQLRSFRTLSGRGVKSGLHAAAARTPPQIQSKISNLRVTTQPSQLAQTTMSPKRKCGILGATGTGIPTIVVLTSNAKSASDSSPSSATLILFSLSTRWAPVPVRPGSSILKPSIGSWRKISQRRYRTWKSGHVSLLDRLPNVISCFQAWTMMLLGILVSSPPSPLDLFLIYRNGIFES